MTMAATPALAKSPVRLPVDAWSEAFRDAHPAPVPRPAALRLWFRDTFAVCCALVEGMPEEQRLARTRAYLTRYHEALGKTLKPNSWKLAALAWIAKKDDFLGLVCAHNPQWARRRHRPNRTQAAAGKATVHRNLRRRKP